MKFIKPAFHNLCHGALSAGAWALIWVVAFFFGTGLIENLVENQKAIEVTALALTITVVSGRMAKLISCAVGGDADFKHLFLRDERRNRMPPKPVRLIMSVSFLSAAIFLIYRVGDRAIKPEKIFNSAFMSYSFHFWNVIFLLFLAQMVFSWPEPLAKSAPADGS